jgi:uncharacterized protein YtpQ (UPF0354 family)
MNKIECEPSYGCGLTMKQKTVPATPEDLHEIYKFVTTTAGEAMALINKRILERPEEERFLLVQRITSVIFQLNHKMVINALKEEHTMEVRVYEK